jgi:hypothetical protein
MKKAKNLSYQFVGKVGQRIIDGVVKHIGVNDSATITLKNGEKRPIFNLNILFKNDSYWVMWMCPVSMGKTNSRNKSAYDCLLKYLKMNGIYIPPDKMVSVIDSTIQFTVNKICNYPMAQHIWISNVNFITPEKRKRIILNKMVNIAKRNNQDV